MKIFGMICWPFIICCCCCCFILSLPIQFDAFCFGYQKNCRRKLPEKMDSVCLRLHWSMLQNNKLRLSLPQKKIVIDKLVPEPLNQSIILGLLHCLLSFLHYYVIICFFQYWPMFFLDFNVLLFSSFISVFFWLILMTLVKIWFGFLRLKPSPIGFCRLTKQIILSLYLNRKFIFILLTTKLNPQSNLNLI